MGTIPASENEFPQVLFAEGAAPATPGTGLVVCYVKSDGLLYCKDDAGTETAYAAAGTALSDHLADTGDAHDASSISIVDAGTLYTATDVEAALAEVMAAVGAGGIPVTIIDAAGDLIVGTAADTAGRLAVGATGTVLVGGSSPSWGKGNPVKDFAHATRQSTALTVNGTSWANVDTALDLTLTAVSGDVIEVGFSAFWGNEGTTGNIDAVTMVGGSPVNSVSTGAAPDNANNGVSAWRGTASQSIPSGGSIMYTLQSGDISSGTVTLRLRVRTAAASNKTLNATAAIPLHWYAKNLGQQL